MHIDCTLARKAFDTYVSAYDPQNPRIALKVDHTLRVAVLCDRIARAQGNGNPGLIDEDVDLAWLCGLLHDIGRFEQVRRFDTFNDAASVSHAALGSDVLFVPDAKGDKLIRSFVADDDEDELIRTAIATHSAYRLPADLDSRTRTYCDILRDADKIDILAVNCLCPIEDIYGVTEHDMRTSKLSPAVVETFYEHRTIPRDIRQYPADILVGHICFAWELVYSESRRITRKQGYLDRMLSRTFSDPETQRTFAQMAAHMRTQL